MNPRISKFTYLINTTSLENVMPEEISKKKNVLNRSILLAVYLANLSLSLKTE